MQDLSVIGAGSWGTTLAWILAEKGYGVRLWARSAALCEEMKAKRENSVYLPGVRLPKTLVPTDSLEEALSGSKFIVSVIPSHGLRPVFSGAKQHISEGAVIVSATKGIEEGTHLTATEILKDVLSPRRLDLVVLSGPSFAKEVSLGLPAAVSAASGSLEAARSVQSAFSTAFFRVYTNPDVAGVELGGALKNVIAVASGISDGLGLGNSARAALITRGLAEITRLGVRKGASAQTFSGLSGMGDLVLTCTGALSRNYTVGVEVGKGRRLQEVTGQMKMVAEGVRTSKAARELARSMSVEMPITEAVCSVIYEGKPPREAVYELMARELKCE